MNGCVSLTKGASLVRGNGARHSRRLLRHTLSPNHALSPPYRRYTTSIYTFVRHPATRSASPSTTAFDGRRAQTWTGV